MNREIKIGDWGWFWLESPDESEFSRVDDLDDSKCSYPYRSISYWYKNFSHEHPTGRFIVTENPNTASNDPYAELKKAYEEGATIQMHYKFFDSWIDVFNKSDNPVIPTWKFNPEEYRIKPEPRYRPYTFEDREEFRGKWIQYDGYDNERQIVDIGPQGISWEPERIFSYDELFRYCKFTDGTPFGKLIEE